MKINFDSSKKQNPVYEGGMKIEYAPAKRAKSAWKWYAIVIITASPLLFFLGKILISYILISAPGVVSLRKIDLNSPETASIAKIYIKKGDKITKGSLIANLSDPAVDDQISILNSELESLLRRKAVSKADYRLEASIGLAEKILDNQTAYLGKVRYLFTKGAATAAELNLVTNQHNQAQLEVFRARADYAASRVIRPDAEAESRIERLKKEIEALNKKGIRLEFKSQYSGVVSELFASENQSIARGTPFAKLSIPGEYTIRAYIDPSNINHVKKDKKVTIRMPGNSLLNGYIVSDPETAGRIPAEFSGVFSEAKQAIEVNIATSSPLPGKYQIDGLPIKVYFGFPGF